MAWVINHNFLKSQLDASASVVDFDTDTIKIMLVDDTAAPDEDSDQFIDDVSANEVSGTNYSAGGATLASADITLTTGVATFDADDVVIAQSGAGFTDARYAFLYKDTGTPATSPIIAHADLGADKGNVAGALTLQFDAAGIATWS